MAQEDTWDREYKRSKLLTKENKPQQDVLRFVEFLRREGGLELVGLQVLDLGSGAGRNSFYFSELGNQVTGIEISKTAIEISKEYAKAGGLTIDYIKQSMGESFPLPDNSIEVVLDITSSNSLTESEREICISETNRVLKSGGHFFLKALCKEGDMNAKTLLKQFPGKEKDTYIMPGLQVTERVWSKEDLFSTYGKYFNIVKLEKKTSYSRMNDRVYKRNFWICYMKKS